MTESDIINFLPSGQIEANFLPDEPPSEKSFYPDLVEPPVSPRDSNQASGKQKSLEPDLAESTFNPTTSNRNPGAIPENLIPFIYHSTDSLTYLALTGRPMTCLSSAVQNSIINDLRKYVDTAIDNSLITEAIYIQNIIDMIKDDKSYDLAIIQKEIQQIDQKIHEINVELDERLSFWKVQEDAAESELDLSLTSLDLQYRQAVAALDEEWQSPKKVAQFSKPSPALLNLREMAKKMIRSKQLDEVNKIGQLISEKEQSEISLATEKMNVEYRAADLKLQEKYESEKKNYYECPRSKS